MPLSNATLPDGSEGGEVEVVRRDCLHEMMNPGRKGLDSDLTGKRARISEQKDSSGDCHSTFDTVKEKETAVELPSEWKC